MKILHTDQLSYGEEKEGREGNTEFLFFRDSELIGETSGIFSIV